MTSKARNTTHISAVGRSIRAKKPTDVRVVGRPRILRPTRSVAAVLRQYLDDQLATGSYPVGSLLPSVRALAKRVGVNRNTVSKVYQELARDGVVQGKRGVGIIVAAATARVRWPLDRLNEAVATLVSEASAASVPREWLLERVE